MSTNLKFKEPKNFLIFTTEQDVLSATYTEVKTKVDKKTSIKTYEALWTLSTINEALEAKVIGCLRTPIEPSGMQDVEDRIKEIADDVAYVMSVAHETGVEDVLTEPEGREIIAAAHCRWHSQELHSVDYEHVVNVMKDLISEFKVKNVKKVLQDVLGVEIKEVKEANKFAELDK
jgi:hypothetical protein